MPSHRGPGAGAVDSAPDSSARTAVDEVAAALTGGDGRRSRAAWPNSREDRYGRPAAPAAAAGATSTGRRSAVPAQRSATALATPPGGLHDLASLLGVPGQRSAPPAALDLPSWHPSAPVPAPQPPPGWAAPAPAADEVDALPARRRRRTATGLPQELPPATGAPAAPTAPAALAPAAAPAVEAPAPLTRRARRAALTPLDATPRTAAAPAAPGSRRALREQRSTAAAPAPLPAPVEARAEAPADVPAPGGSWAAPLESDTDVLARLEALLGATAPVWEPEAAPAPSVLDLRTDPLLPHVGWSRHTPSEPAPAVPEALLAAPAELPLRPRTAPTAAVAAPEAPLPAPALAPATAALAVAEALSLDAVPEDDARTGRATAFVPRRGRASHRLPRRARVALPHVAVVGVLGVATLVAPLAGTHLRAEADTGLRASTSDAGASTAQAAAAAGAAGAADLLAGRTSAALSRSAARDDAALQSTADRAAAAKQAADAAAQAAFAQTAQQKAAEEAQAQAAAKEAAEHQAAVAALVGDCSGDRPDTTGDRNGRLPSSQLCGLWVGGHQLRSDAAVAFAELDLAYKEHFGEDLVITDSYRSYSAQVAVRRKKPSLAAVPGTSEHGWGLAVDLGGGVEDSDEHYAWLIENAPKYGWDHPAWARKGGGGPYEPWHWEYVAGE